MGGLQQSVVSGGHELFIGWLFEQVSSQLFFGKLIEWKIPIEGIDHVIAVRRGGVILITMVADGAGKTDQIKPVGGHPFSKGRLRQQGINPIGHHLVKRSLVLGEGIHLIGMRRQTGKVEMKPADQGDTVGIRGWIQSAFLKLGKDEAINPMVRPFLSRRRYGFFTGRLVGPIFFVLRPLENPLLDNFALLGLHHLVGLGGWHNFVWVRIHDAGPHLAGFQVARDQGGITSEVAGSSFLGVKTQVGLTFVGIRPMAKEAVVREDRTDIGVKIHRRRQSP